MNEKYVEALEQYDMEVLSVRKGRGSWICETRDGIRMLREYRGTIKRLEFEDEVLGMLDTRGSIRTDQYVRNREGSLLTMAGDGTKYILKEWFLDRECNIKDGLEIRQALTRLAMLHVQLRGIAFKEEWSMGSILPESLEEELERHNREMQRARSYIRGKRRKSEFELCVIGSFDMFYDQALEAVQGLKELWGGKADLGFDALEAAEVHRPYEAAGGPDDAAGQLAAEADCLPSGREKAVYLCHGDLDHHHILMGSSYTAIIEYNRMHLGLQVTDLYRFMRKVMEKHSWNPELGMSMLDSYNRILPMDEKERSCLYYLFLYPEKYWKQLNFYYNANKAWIPARNIDKLHGLSGQQPERNSFLKCLKARCPGLS